MMVTQFGSAPTKESKRANFKRGGSEKNIMFAFKKNEAKVLSPIKDFPTESVSRSGSADNGVTLKVPVLTPTNESGLN